MSDSNRTADLSDEIFGVAIMRGSLYCWMIRPARHHDLRNAMAQAGIRTPIGHAGDVQGFQTSRGFLSREDAACMIGHPHETLFSEDLW